MKTIKLTLRQAAKLHYYAELGKAAAGIFHELMNQLTALTLTVEQSGQLGKTLLTSRKIGHMINTIKQQHIITQTPELISLPTR